MNLELTGPQRAELRKALLDAFPRWDDLAILVSDQLGQNLAAFAAQAKGQEAVTFELIEWARARGQVADLILGARNQNPGNGKLGRFAAEVSLSSYQGVTGGTLEALVSRNTVFLDSAKWRAEHARNEWRVCRVDKNGKGTGTGFLVADDVVLTNHHVVKSLLADASTASSWTFRFDHKLSEDGTVISMGREVKLAPEWAIDHSATGPGAGAPTPGDEYLDFAALRLAEPIGKEPVGKGEGAERRGFVTARATQVDFAAIRGIAILQHPDARPMQLALDLTQQLVLDAATQRVHHAVPTLPGSSGSPVFDSDWRLVAMHQGAAPGADPTSNRAIPIALIAARPKVAAILGE